MLNSWSIRDNGDTQELQTKLVHITVTKVDVDRFFVSAYSPDGIVEPKNMTIRTTDMDEAKKSIMSYIQVKSEDVRKKALSLSIMLGHEIKKLETNR